MSILQGSKFRPEIIQGLVATDKGRFSSVDDIFFGDQYGEQIRLFQKQLEIEAVDAVLEVLAFEELERIKNLSKFEKPKAIDDLLSGKKSALFSVPRTEDEDQKIREIFKLLDANSSQMVRKAYGLLKKNALVTEAKDFLYEEEYSEYVEEAKKFRYGYHDEQTGNWVLGWDSIQKFVSGELDKYEQLIKDPKYEIFLKLAKVGGRDASKIIHDLTSRTRINFQLLQGEFDFLHLNLAKYRDLYSSIVKFREKNVVFPKEKLAQLNDFNIHDFNLSNKDKQNIVQLTGKNFNKINIQLPEIKPVKNQFLKRVNDFLKNIGAEITFFSAGAKSYESTKRKAAQARYNGNAGKISDVPRLTCSIDFPQYSHSIRNKIIEKLKQKYKFDGSSFCDNEDWHCENSFYISSKINFPVSMEVNGKLEHRVAEFKIPNRYQQRHKSLADQAYLLNRLLRPEDKDSNRWLITSEAPEATLRDISTQITANLGINKIVKLVADNEAIRNLNFDLFKDNKSPDNDRIKEVANNVLKLEQYINLGVFSEESCHKEYLVLAYDLVCKQCVKNNGDGLSKQEVDNYLKEIMKPKDLKNYNFDQLKAAHEDFVRNNRGRKIG